MRVRTLATPELGNRTYVVDDGTAAIVIDPQRDLDRLEPLLEDGPEPTYVLETHVHNDYVTGGLELARRTGADYGVNADDAVCFERLPLRDDQPLHAGGLRVRVVATPGHTDTHLSYVVDDPGSPEQPPAVFSGGSLLYGTVGRTDLVSPDLTVALSRAQYRSARRLATLPGASRLYPTHGFGSFCSGGGGTGAELSTIAEELEKNPVLTETDEAAFVAGLVASLSAYPAYYAQMAPLNRQGPGPVDLHSVPEPLSAERLAELIAGDAVVVDLRDGESFAAGHLAGTVSIGLGSQLATYVGWLTPWGRPLVLVGTDADQLLAARRQLARIGIDWSEAAWGPLDRVAPASVARRSFPRRTFDELADQLGPDDVIVDVRRHDEYRDEHLRGAHHLPVHEIAARHGELPRRRLWVHCAGGYRAGTAASLLEAEGFDVVHVDDSFGRAVDLGLTTAG